MNSYRVAILAAVVTGVIAATGGYYTGKRVSGADGKKEGGVGRVVQAIGGEGLVDEDGGSTGDAGGDSAAGEGALAANGLAGGLGTLEGGGAEVKIFGSVREILDQPGPLDRWQAMMAYAKSLDASGVRAALAELKQAPPDIDSFVARFFLYSQFAEGDPEGALGYMKELAGGDQELARESIVSAWAGSDPEAAAGYLMTQVDEDGKLTGVNARMVRSIANEWARSDPKAAFQWALQLDEGAKRQAMGALLGQWVSRDPMAASVHVKNLEPSEEREEMFAGVAGFWARQDHQAALNWVRNLPEEERSPAMVQAMNSWAEQNPQGAAQYLSTMEAGEARDGALRRVASQWARQDDPAEAAAWLATQEGGGEEMHKAMRDVVGKWAEQSEYAASQWLAERPPGPATDGAIVGLTERVARKDPEAAAIWALAISDGGSRSKQVERIVGQWMKRDRKAASAWLADTTEVPAPVRERLLAPGAP